MTGRPDDAGGPGMAAAHPLGFAPDAADATQPIPVITEPVQQAVSRTDAPAAAGPDRPGSATGAPAAPASPGPSQPYGSFPALAALGRSAPFPEGEPAQPGPQRTEARSAEALARTAEPDIFAESDIFADPDDFAAAFTEDFTEPDEFADPDGTESPSPGPAATAAAAAPVTRSPDARRPRPPEEVPEELPAGPPRRARMSARRRDWLAAAAVIVVAVLAAGSAGAHAMLGGRTAPAAPPAGSQADVSNLAATWVAEQVSRAAIVSCDPVMCDVLRQHGFPVSDLMELRPGGTGVLQSVVVVATSAIRQQVGGILSSVYAPGVLARFGKGARQIDIRTVARQGPATYQQQLSADQRARRESGAELLTSSRIAATPSARRELTAGLVDSRLLVTIAALAGQRPVKILGFGHSGPGVTPATSPLRSVELTQMPGGRQLPRAEFLRSTLAFLRAQRSPFYASGVQEIRMTGGGTALRVIFSAPSPLGLLSGAVATPPGG